MKQRKLPSDVVSINAISIHYDTLDRALQLYFEELEAPRFLGRTHREVRLEHAERRRELGRTTTLSVMTTLEAYIRVDYENRVGNENRPKGQQPGDRVSEEFRRLSREANRQRRSPHLNDLLDCWARAKPQIDLTMRHLKEAFRYRHWLAHGRYWTLEPRLRLDVAVAFDLADRVKNELDFSVSH